MSFVLCSKCNCYFIVHRVYSTVIGNGRTLQADTVICGYKIPKGVSVHSASLIVLGEDLAN